MWSLITLLTLMSAMAVVYHHLVYPWMLSRLGEKRLPQVPVPPARGWQESPEDAERPLITLLLPAYQEAAAVAEKIRNLSTLDYPNQRWEGILVCDGCTDHTAAIARQTLAEPECAHLPLRVVEEPINRGKVAVLNRWIPQARGDLVALSDISALLSTDAFLVAAARFQDPDLGVLTGHYQLLQPGTTGEHTYWEWQSRIKALEGALGATIGVHGAFYLFRRQLFQPLADDTINDDFVLPMSIVAAGYRADYAPEINALETESTPMTQDGQRRRRIAAGNLQQAWRLRHLLSLRRLGIAFTFASGKVLRAAMPFLLVVLLVGSLLLSLHRPAWYILLIPQAAAYLLATWRQLCPNVHAPRWVVTIHYLVMGYLNGLIGSVNYLLKGPQGPWRRICL